MIFFSLQFRNQRMSALNILLKNKFEKLVQLPASILCLNYSSFAKMIEYKKCCRILGIPEDSDQEGIRRAYLELVKRYHPDGGAPEADANKFSEIDRAFKILINKKSKERWDIDDTVKEQDIKHIAPQHRQYLSYDGIGMGSPFQRQKQYTKVRALHAVENVLKHRMNKISAEEGALLAKAPLKHKIKTKYGLEQLVENVIQESISRGEFTNLPGSGKPLDHQNRNPYVDFVTHKLNEIMIDNGFTPEWITLQKEIRKEMQQLREDLLVERSHLGACPLNSEENLEWNDIICKYAAIAEKINKKINKFNLVVPIINKQMIQIDLQKEAQKILTEGQHNQGFKESRSGKTIENPAAETEIVNMFDLIEKLFKK